MPRRTISRITGITGVTGVAGLALFFLCLGCLGSDRAGKEEDGAAERRLSGAARGWNVVLLSIDTLRADRLGAYGYTARPTSPNLDALLAGGVRFEQAMAPRSSTWPSLASALTGLYPRSHGVIENGYGFPDELPTLPKLLAASGYRTGAFLSNMCRANHQGWESFACSGGNDGKAVRKALAWMEGLEGERPFLLWVHLFGAHSPYYNGGDHAARVLDPGYDGPLGPKKWRLDKVMTERLPLAERDVRHLDALYDAAVMGSDRQAANLLEKLRALGKLERTIVVLLADHGEELYDHNNYLYHSCSVYQTGLHVPLGFSAPGLLPAGIAIPEAVELIDVAPTLLDLLGIALPAERHGRSLVPRMASPSAALPATPSAPIAAFSEYGTEPINTVVQGNWKLIYNPRGLSPVCIPDAPPGHYPIGRQELYDLAKDPGETTNLAAAHPEKVTELARLIRRRFAGLTDRVQSQRLPDDLKEELKSLGYVAH